MDTTMGIMAGWKRLHLGHSQVPSAEWLLISSWNDLILKIMASVLSQLMVFKNLIISNQIFLCVSLPLSDPNIQVRVKSDLKRRENPTQSLWITTIALGNRYNDHNGLIEERLADFTASIYCWSYCLPPTPPTVNNMDLRCSYHHHHHHHRHHFPQHHHHQHNHFQLQHPHFPLITVKILSRQMLSKQGEEWLWLQISSSQLKEIIFMSMLTVNTVELPL